MHFIEPFPSNVVALLGAREQYKQNIIPHKLQEVPLDIFARLQSGDILFIDSSHVAKTGSDVLDYMFRIMPVLKPGVVVHIHDIFYPFEYPKDWIATENRSWNEAYLVRAFLQENPKWSVLFMFDWFFKCQLSLLIERMPLCVEHRGGSLWIQRI